MTKVIKLRLIASQAGVSHIKPDLQGLRLSVAYRLKEWLPIQNNLPKHLARVTTYKPGIAGGGSGPYIIVKADGVAPSDQLNLLDELLSAMVANCQPSSV